ncbi:MAG: hypothetical protein AAF915_19640 [Cyanobacteria bacterium P01_D01_bin.50]
MIYEVYAPNVHLFAFHLRDDSLSDNYNNKLLWHKCQEILKKFEIPQELKIKDVAPNTRVDLLEEATDKNIYLSLESAKSEDEKQKTRVTGIACPLQIYDSYALALNLRIDEFDEFQKNKTEPVGINIFKNFNPDNCFLSTNIHSSLGQTLLLTAWLSPDQQQDATLWRKIAQQCVQNFCGQTRECPQLYQESILFDSPIFEYSNPNSSHGYEHILVWLFFAEEEVEKYYAKADENLSLFYQEFIDLFFYRNKVIKSFHLSRDVYVDIHNLYKDFKQIVRDIAKIRTIENNLLVTDKSRDLSAENKRTSPQNTALPQILPENDLRASNTIRQLSNDELKYYQDKLSILPSLDLQYSEYLAELDKYHLTIKTNTTNYTEKLRQIQEKSSSKDLSFLANFNQIISMKFANQIQTDLGYFSHTSGLVDKAITSIRGIVEIEQAERDRTTQEILRQKEEAEKQRNDNLQTAVAVLGFGLGAAQIGVSTAPYIIPQQQPPTPIQVPFTTIKLCPFAASVVLSLVFGVVGAFVGWGCSYLFQANPICRFKAIQASRNQSAILTESKPTAKGKTK